MNNCVLKLIVFVENILSIYRNYEALSAKKKVMVSIRMIIESILIFMITAIHMRLIVYNYEEEYRLMNFCFNVTYSLVAITLARYNSTKFMNFVKYIEKAHKLIIQDEIYLKNIQQKSRIIKTTILFYVISIICIMIYLLHNYTEDKLTFLFSLVIYLICEIRYVVEYIVLYGILAVLSEQVKSITRIITEGKEYAIREHVHNSQIKVTTRIVADFRKLTKIYTTVKDGCTIKNSIFGVEISIILIMASGYFIILSYITIGNLYSSIKLSQEDVVYTIHRAAVFMIALYLLSQGAHSEQRSVEELRRSLASLLIRSTGDQSSYKVIKDFLRYVTYQPLKTQAFSLVTIDMTLVPKFIMFFTSYTVIALQFNNVM